MNKALGILILLLSFTFCNGQTVEEVWQEIQKDSIKHPEIVLRQAIWETGWFKSSACKHNHNLFGFNNGKMKFKTWQESVAYYKQWQDKYYKNDSLDYYKFLIKIKYAANGPAYVKCLKSLKLPPLQSLKLDSVPPIKSDSLDLKIPNNK
jgi:hypothetical protein